MTLTGAAQLDAVQASRPDADDISVRLGIVVTLFFEGGATPDKQLAALAVVRNYCERFRN